MNSQKLLLSVEDGLAVDASSVQPLTGGRAISKAVRQVLREVLSRVTICWMCKLRVADSREHRIKASLIRFAYGRGPYRHSEAHPTAFSLEKNTSRMVQGPDSDVLKYPPSLCRRCNGTVSQKADTAYDTFHKWCISHVTQVDTERKIDFKKVFGSDFVPHVENLLRYYCKALGCGLHYADVLIPHRIAEAARGGDLPANFDVHFYLDEFIRSANEVFEPYFEGARVRLSLDTDDGALQYHLRENIDGLVVYVDFTDRPKDWNCKSQIDSRVSTISLGTSSGTIQPRNQEEWDALVERKQQTGVRSKRPRSSSD